MEFWNLWGKLGVTFLLLLPKNIYRMVKLHGKRPGKSFSTCWVVLLCNLLIKCVQITISYKYNTIEAEWSFGYPPWMYRGTECLQRSYVSLHVVLLVIRHLIFWNTDVVDWSSGSSEVVSEGEYWRARKRWIERICLQMWVEFKRGPRDNLHHNSRRGSVIRIIWNVGITTSTGIMHNFDVDASGLRTISSTIAVRDKNPE